MKIEEDQIKKVILREAAIKNGTCEMEGLEWDKINYGEQAYSIVASWRGNIGVWIMQVGGLSGSSRNAMSRLDSD